MHEINLFKQSDVYNNELSIIAVRFTYDVIIPSYHDKQNKRIDMYCDTKNGQKVIFYGKIPANGCRSMWRGLKPTRLIFKKIKYLKSFMHRICQL